MEDAIAKNRNGVFFLSDVIKVNSESMIVAIENIY